MLAVAAGAPAAHADVCTGGAPYAATGSPPASLLTAAPVLQHPHWSLEELPQWVDNTTFGNFGNAAAYAWYSHATLWAVDRGSSWWVIPVQSCSVGPDNTNYDLEDCVTAAYQLTLESFDCQDVQQLAHPSAPTVVTRGSVLMVSGFVPPATGSVQIAFAHGSRTFPAFGGVYGGTAPAALGAAGLVTDLAAALARPKDSVVLVDQTGLFSSSQGPLASTGRLNSLAARLHAHLAITATILGTAVTGHRQHSQVLYGPGAHALAQHVAGVLHASSPHQLSGGPLSMFGSLARVVVLVGRHD